MTTELSIVDTMAETLAKIGLRTPELLPDPGTPERATADALIASYLKKIGPKGLQKVLSGADPGQSGATK